MIRMVLAAALAVMGNMATAGMSGVFDSIDGGTVSIEAWRGQPVLVVNTASQCGFTYQYGGLQKVYDDYRAQGLVVFAVPSDDFNQELETGAEVKEFCEMTFGLDMPMADITPVTGAGAHPFYRQVQAETGFVPRWNFNKVLLNGEGDVVATWGASVRPESRKVRREIERLLN